MNKRLMGVLAEQRQALDFYLRYGRGNENPSELVSNILATAQQIMNSPSGDPCKAIAVFSAMGAAATLLDVFYPLLYREGLLEETYSIHPNPTLLSKASRSYMYSLGSDNEAEAKAISLEALRLGGFPTLADVQESFGDFKIQHAPESIISKLILENTFSSLGFFCIDKKSKPIGGRYFSVLLAKIIDSGELKWAVEFIERNQADLEGYSPIQFRRLDVEGPSAFKLQYLIYLQNYLSADKMLSQLSRFDSDTFDAIVGAAETHEQIIYGIQRREGFDLSSIPLPPDIAKKLVTEALGHSLVSRRVEPMPLKVIDLSKLECSFMASGLRSSGFLKILQKQSYFDAAIASTNRLMEGIDHACGDLAGLMALAEQFELASMDFVAVSAFADPSIKDLLVQNIESLSALLVMRGHDACEVLGVDRKKISLLELRAVSIAEGSRVCNLVDAWSARGHFKRPDTLAEIARIKQEDLARFLKRTEDEFSKDELRKIPWRDARIRDAYFGEDLGL